MPPPLPAGAVLAAVCGPRDPDFPAASGLPRRAGPLLRLVRARPYEAVVLVGDAFRAEACAAALAAECPDLPVRVEACPDADAPEELARQLVQLNAHHVYLPPERPEDHWRFTCALARLDQPATLLVVELDPHDPVPLDIRPWRIEAAPWVHEPGAYAAPARAVRLRPAPGEDTAAALAAEARRLGLVGEAPAFRQALRACAVLAPHPAPVLIRGETGTGKELMARLLHALGGRRERPFVAVNCGALPAALMESILFGHRKGAFTGATQDQAGKFQQADGGVLFLDEIGELPPELQPKLLRVLQDGVVEPVGAGEGRRVDVRVVAATHRDLRARAAEGLFREDLFYRLSFGRVELPPLRERPGDLPALAARALEKINAGFRHPKRLSAAALARLARHPWPGNVRELEGVLTRSALWCAGEVLEPEDLQLEPPTVPAAALPEPHEGFSLEAYLADSRERLIRRALDLSGGNQSAAARLLGVSPQAVSKFLLREEGRT